jgi:hypothetical protein
MLSRRALLLFPLSRLAQGAPWGYQSEPVKPMENEELTEKVLLHDWSIDFLLNLRLKDSARVSRLEACMCRKDPFPETGGLT